MPEAFKHQIGPALVARMARSLHQAGPAFDPGRFSELALQGLDALELKARVDHLASALQATLPEDFEQAAAQVEAALAPPPPGDSLEFMRAGVDGLAGWAIWPLGEWVVRRGLHQPERALACLRELTQRSTAEFAIRPFIARHPALAWSTLQRWCDDASPHVRRLVSEGSRPRLPWGMRLQALVDDPTPTLPLLQRLQDDASAYVRRSVANHLNDIAKDHPQQLWHWLDTHLPGASAQRRALLRHASRTRIKQGDARVLAHWGGGQPMRGQATLRLTPGRLVLGRHVTLQVTLRSTSAHDQSLIVDYVVHHVRADGSTSPKVFKGRSLTLPARQTLQFEKDHPVRPVTTRRYHAGQHRVELQINGRVVAADAFLLSV